MKEHKAETIEKMLEWWPELRSLTEHAKVIGIRLVVQHRDEKGAFQFGELEIPLANVFDPFHALFNSPTKETD